MRIGAVSYLNTKPLVHGLPRNEQIQLRFDLPSRLADDLASGSLDVALIPVIEAVSDPEYSVVSDACIACRGPVWSVKLLSRVPLREIRSLSLDEGSRTSAALVQVLLDQNYGLRPELCNFPIGSPPEAMETDAVLVIGDRAMKNWSHTFPYQWDLGEEWLNRTGHPFVFAVWTARRQTNELDWLESTLANARDHGMQHVDEIAVQQAPRHGLTEQQCLDYLKQHLHFTLGPSERAGLQEFLSEAKRLNLIPSISQLKFHDCQAAG